MISISNIFTFYYFTTLNNPNSETVSLKEILDVASERYLNFKAAPELWQQSCANEENSRLVTLVKLGYFGGDGQNRVYIPVFLGSNWAQAFPCARRFEGGLFDGISGRSVCTKPGTKVDKRAWRMVGNIGHILNLVVSCNTYPPVDTEVLIVYSGRTL